MSDLSGGEDESQSGRTIDEVDSAIGSAAVNVDLGDNSNIQGAVNVVNHPHTATSLLNSTSSAFNGLCQRIQTLLAGSTGKVGWLLNEPNLPASQDRTERFIQLLGRTSNGVHTLPDDLLYILVPGLFSNLGPLYFVDVKKYLSGLGLSCHIAKIHSESSVETNAREIKNLIEEMYWGTGKRIALLGHSKGGIDAAAAFAMFWTDLKDKVVGLILAQSPYGGSALASDLLREGQLADFETRQIIELVLTKLNTGDMLALQDLTYESRKEFLANHPLPDDALAVSFHTEAERGWSEALLSLSIMHHATCPVPFSALMAITAWHLHFRYNESSDGLVMRKDAEVPGSFVVKPSKKFDHGWMVFSPSIKQLDDVDAAQVCEALLTLLVEEDARRRDSSLGNSTGVSTSRTSEIKAGEKYLDHLET